MAKRRASDEEAALTMTPLVDVVLLLLIFYIVTTSFVDREIDLQLPDSGISFDQVQRDILLAALEKNDWNQSKTARYVGLTRNTLIYRMRKFGLTKQSTSESDESR